MCAAASLAGMTAVVWASTNVEQQLVKTVAIRSKRKRNFHEERTPDGGLSAVLDRHYRRESRRLPRLVLRRLARPRDLPVVRRLLTGLILESNQGRSPGIR